MDDEAVREAKIREFDRYFCATDAVLREDCFAVANAAVNYKGPDGVATFRAKDVIQKLADGYKGYAAIASLVCSWLNKLESQPASHVQSSQPGEHHNAQPWQDMTTFTSYHDCGRLQMANVMTSSIF